MANVRVLELAGARPQLRIEDADLDTVRLPAGGPRLRVIELVAPGAAVTTQWRGVKALRGRAYTLLKSPAFADRFADELRQHRILRLDVTAAPRAVPETLDALRAQAALERGMFVLDVELPDNAPDRLVTDMIEAWQQQLLDDEDLAVPRGRIERAPPQPAAAVAPQQTDLQQLLADNATFLDSVTVGRALAGNPAHANPKMVTTRARRAGQIFGVWDGNAYRYPAFQFNDAGQPRTDVPALIAALPRDADGSGRAAALWLFAPDAAFGGQAPAAAFPTHAQRVIAVARRRRGEDPTSD